MKAWNLVLSKEINVTKKGDKYFDDDGYGWNEDELACLQKDNDWDQYYIQATIAAMQAYISDGERMALVSKKFDYDDEAISKFIAEGAVMYANSVIEELKKKISKNYET